MERQWARGAFGVVAFVAVLEVCARVDDAVSYGAPLWGRYGREENLFTRDAIGRRGRPGGRYEKWQLNSLGYRGPELRPGTLRIVCIGASETFGLYEAEGEEYPRQLERELNARAGTDVIQVVNAGIAGQTIATATLRVGEIVDEIHPAFAIIYPAVTTYIWLPRIRLTPGASSALRITERVRNLLKQVLPSAVQAKVRQRVIEEKLAQHKYTVMDRVPEENVRALRNDLLRLVAVLRARGVEPALATHATVFGKQLSEPDRDIVLTVREFYPMLSEDGFLDMEQRMNNAIREVASQEHILLIDAANEVPPGRMYFGDYSHFRSAGAAVMAARLADGLQPLIEARLRGAGRGARDAIPSNARGDARPRTGAASTHR